MPQQDYYTRTLNIMTPNGRIQAGSSESTALDAGTTTGVKFIHIRCKTSATSGDTRAEYVRLYLNGDGGDGEALRAFTTVNAKIGGSAHGAHISLNYGSAGNTQAGRAVGMRATLHVRNAAMTGALGSIYGAESELYADGSDTDFGQASNHAIHRFTVAGDASGKNTVDFGLEFALTPSGQGLYTSGVTNTTMLNSLTHAIKCKINGSTVYLPFCTAIA